MRGLTSELPFPRRRSRVAQCGTKWVTASRGDCQKLIGPSIAGSCAASLQIWRIPGITGGQTLAAREQFHNFAVIGLGGDLAQSLAGG